MQNERIAEILRRLPAFVDAFREQWYYENKTFGFEIQEQYFGGLMLRLSSAAKRLCDYCDGKTARIEELEQEVLDFYCYDGAATGRTSTPSTGRISSLPARI